MKRLILLLALILISQSSFAQTDFFVPGATWVYYLPPNGGAFYPETEELTTILGDTVVGGLDSKRLVSYRRTIDHFNGGFQSSFTTERYVSIQSDSILIYQNDQWNLVFRTGVESGDSLIVYLDEYDDSGCVRNDTIVISEVGDTIIQGQQLARFEFVLLVNDWFESGAEIEYKGEFIERIGFTELHPVENPFFCFSPIASYWPPRFYCYSDDEIIVSPQGSCHQILSVDDLLEAIYNIWYSNGILEVQNAPNSILYIYDILGKELLQTAIQKDNQIIDLSHLPNGILMVVCESDKNRFTKKIMKSDR